MNSDLSNTSNSEPALIQTAQPDYTLLDVNSTELNQTETPVPDLYILPEIPEILDTDFIINLDKSELIRIIKKLNKCSDEEKLDFESWAHDSMDYEMKVACTYLAKEQRLFEALQVLQKISVQDKSVKPESVKFESGVSSETPSVPIESPSQNPTLTKISQISTVPVTAVTVSATMELDGGSNNDKFSFTQSQAPLLGAATARSPQISTRSSTSYLRPANRVNQVSRVSPASLVPESSLVGRSNSNPNSSRFALCAHRFESIRELTDYVEKKGNITPLQSKEISEEICETKKMIDEHYFACKPKSGEDSSLIEERVKKEKSKLKQNRLYKITFRQDNLDNCILQLPHYQSYRENQSCVTPLNKELKKKNKNMKFEVDHILMIETLSVLNPSISQFRKKYDGSTSLLVPYQLNRVRTFGYETKSNYAEISDLIRGLFENVYLSLTHSDFLVELVKFVPDKKERSDLILHYFSAYWADFSLVQNWIENAGLYKFGEQFKNSLSSEVSEAKGSLILFHFCIHLVRVENSFRIHTDGSKMNYDENTLQKIKNNIIAQLSETTQLFNLIKSEFKKLKYVKDESKFDNFFYNFYKNTISNSVTEFICITDDNWSRNNNFANRIEKEFGKQDFKKFKQSLEEAIDVDNQKKGLYERYALNLNSDPETPIDRENSFATFMFKKLENLKIHNPNQTDKNAICGLQEIPLKQRQSYSFKNFKIL